MPRQLSFAATERQFVDGSKTVTRRLGWRNLKRGDVLVAVRKSQGLRKGEKVQKLGTIEVVDVRRESLWRMIYEGQYGRAECAREGFPPPHEKSNPAVFVSFFCDMNNCDPRDEITRIEFRKIPT